MSNLENALLMWQSLSGNTPCRETCAFKDGYAAARNSWQPIETIPVDEFVDVWVVSLANQSWGRRICDVAKSNGHSSGWVGWAGLGDLYEDERVAFWMHIPSRPELTE